MANDEQQFPVYAEVDGKKVEIGTGRQIDEGVAVLDIDAKFDDASLKDVSIEERFAKPEVASNDLSKPQVQDPKKA